MPKNLKRKRADPFQVKVSELKAFIAEHGEYPRRHGRRWNGEEKDLYGWCGLMRRERRDGWLPEDRAEALRQLEGWEWGKDEHEKPRLEDLKAFLAEHGDYPKRDGKREGEKELGTWISSRRQEYKKGKLSDEGVEALGGLEGWKWEGQFEREEEEREDPFPGRLEELKAFLERHGEYPKQGGKKEGEKELGKWISMRRYGYKKGKLTGDKIAALEALKGWRWEGPVNGTREDLFPGRYKELKAFVEANGEYPKQGGKTEGEQELGKWISMKRYEYKKGKLTDDKISQLQELPGWKWEGPFEEAGQLEELRALAALRELTGGKIQ